ncbi:ribonuclease [Erwinia sp. OLTSP20]|uniref:ribonuclease domain-containing protein n=1 Tax=unclassified Erwinia TaxID=2622719 RepID=UPI000C17A836|nr:MULTISPECIES: ribonuclease domain-containing protein [unclassified Erwinia]PIJ49527.1 ribonuclease [Erwinia sp. OAMSP11]PIJ71193.1 ribonuclease [Erwinia sp. OLSSP12]PIJ79842.1 ribonuclease [Erwinia sp. OLCASP19]PIJ81605.1 ribonuclease [Erwinia sp. OLMTSP26]PIJ84020.1 ribonuclease [Erwinia sp. OLMDSP33]
MSKRLIIAALLAVVAAIYGLRQPHQRAEISTRHDQQQTRARTDDITALTRQQRVISYLQQHQRLPDVYISKNQARRQGWNPAQGNLCQVLPGRAIGGDRFSNREQQLPQQAGRKWFEADINYRCGRRGSDRLLYSSDGLIFVTHDHYQHFQQVNQ